MPLQGIAGMRDTYMNFFQAHEKFLSLLRNLTYVSLMTPMFPAQIEMTMYNSSKTGVKIWANFCSKQNLNYVDIGYLVANFNKNPF